MRRSKFYSRLRERIIKTDEKEQNKITVLYNIRNTADKKRRKSSCRLAFVSLAVICVLSLSIALPIGLDNRDDNHFAKVELLRKVVSSIEDIIALYSGNTEIENYEINYGVSSVGYYKGNDKPLFLELNYIKSEEKDLPSDLDNIDVKILLDPSYQDPMSSLYTPELLTDNAVFNGVSVIYRDNPSIQQYINDSYAYYEIGDLRFMVRAKYFKYNLEVTPHVAFEYGKIITDILSQLI